MEGKTGYGGWSPYLAGALVGVLAMVTVCATTTWMGRNHLALRPVLEEGAVSAPGGVKGTAR